MAGIYIHIPFCKQACHYCNFHFSTSVEFKPRMVRALCKELVIKSNAFNYPIETIYFGGGTPSLLTERQLNKIVDTVYENYTVIEDPEITFEVNPDDVSDAFVRALVFSEVNRVSLGVQSFFDEDLQYMHRAHQSDQAHVAIKKLLSAGFSNMSVDLIYGTPGLTTDRWKRNIELVKEYNIPHISCYQLTVEDKTPLEAFIERGVLRAPDDELAVEQFYVLLDEMESGNYEAYEISNYAKEGFRSNHNAAYWENKPYLGIGPSAHSYVADRRSWNTVVNNRYMEAVESDIIPEESEALSLNDQYNEYILTRLRTIEGVSKQTLTERFPDYLEHFVMGIKPYISTDHVIFTQGAYSLTRTGKVWADRISSELMQ